MYGSHYSTAGYVLHFLLRQEPFTSLAVDMQVRLPPPAKVAGPGNSQLFYIFQGGHFDCPDRLFFSIQASWNGLGSATDVKEVPAIPEQKLCFEIHNLRGPFVSTGDSGVVLLPRGFLESQWLGFWVAAACRWTRCSTRRGIFASR